MTWFESEDEAALALELAVEYLWGIEWDSEKIWKQIDTRLSELDQGLSLNPLNPYYSECGCKVAGDICSQGKYDPDPVPHFEGCSLDTDHKGSCMARLPYDETSPEGPEEDMVVADGSATHALSTAEHAYVLALKNAEAIAEILKVIKDLPAPKLTGPNWPYGINPLQPLGGATQSPSYDSCPCMPQNGGSGICNCVRMDRLPRCTYHN